MKSHYVQLWRILLCTTGVLVLSILAILAIGSGISFAASNFNKLSKIESVADYTGSSLRALYSVNQSIGPGGWNE
jgi:hypothetical protein